MKEKIRFQMRISPETDQKVKAVPPLANCQSQNEFVDWLHYCSCLQAAEAACIRAPELTVTLRMTVRDSATHTCRLIFKLAVEVDMLMHVLASGMEIDPAVLDKLRGRCVQELMSTNGGSYFKDAVNYQNGL